MNKFVNITKASAVLFDCLCVSANNRTAYILHLYRKTVVLSCQRCLFNTGVKKNEQHLNIDENLDHQMSLSISVCVPTTVYIS
jgi:hypothetical protein